MVKTTIKKTTKKTTTKSTKKSEPMVRMDGKKLVIVESPWKVKTISKYLGDEYHIKASVGHIADLVDKDMKKLVEKGFEPEYEISKDKKKVVTDLKKLAKDSSQVILATDEDREWEAIAYHLANFLKLDIKSTPRIVFNEITKPAILEAIEHPRKIDLDLVHAQKSRAVLDKLVWFSISPILWQKIRTWLSAWRVQSVAVKLVIEKEKEILAHKPVEYRQVSADCIYKDQKWKSHPITIFLKKIGDKEEKDNFDEKEDKKEETNEEEKTNLIGGKFEKEKIEKVRKELGISKSDYNISTDPKTWYEIYTSKKIINFQLVDIVTKSSKRSPSAPFITSTLQSIWARAFGWSVRTVMSVAQKLYEAGLITYMRTDSTSLSGTAIWQCKDYIVSNFGDKYHQIRQYRSKSKNAQEAHEAIRPTSINSIPTHIKWTEQEKKLYDLIWKRTVASQMSDATFTNTTYLFSPVIS